MDGKYQPWMNALRQRGCDVEDDPRSLFRPNRDRIDPDRGRAFAPAWYRAKDSHDAFLTGEAVAYI